jgi:hypothetical protein
MYNVGQVLYVILNKRQKVVPVQVVEQVTRRSLKGEETHYSVNVPSREGPREYNLHDLDGEVYETIDDAKSALVKNANRSIENIIENTQKIASHVFNSSSDVDDLILESELPTETDSVKITLENGTIANVKLPDIT